jgi:prepilin-type N-terminal cleavage/methylation domain-containing protein
METKMMKMNKKNGFSLLELLLVVAVGAILLLAGLAVYRNVTNNTNVNEAARLLNIIKQETQRLYQGEGEYGESDLNPILRNAEVIPASALNRIEIRHPFNATVAVRGTDDTFTVLFSDIPQSACLKLGQAYSINDPDFEGITIENQDPDSNSDGEISVAELNISCARGSGKADMTWTFF